MRLADFSVEYLGIEYPEYFQGFGCGKYEHCCYGIGTTEEEAYEGCLNQAADSGLDFNDEVEKRIREEYGTIDNSIISDERSYHYVGLRWNSRDSRLKKSITEFYNVDSDECFDLDNFHYGPQGNYFFLPYSQSSDYSGSTVELCNHSVFLG